MITLLLYYGAEADQKTHTLPPSSSALDIAKLSAPKGSKDAFTKGWINYYHAARLQLHTLTLFYQLQRQSQHPLPLSIIDHILDFISPDHELMENRVQRLEEIFRPLADIKHSKINNLETPYLSLPFFSQKCLKEKSQNSSSPEVNLEFNC